MNRSKVRQDLQGIRKRFVSLHGCRANVFVKNGSASPLQGAVEEVVYLYVAGPADLLADEEPAIDTYFETLAESLGQKWIKRESKDIAGVPNRTWVIIAAPDALV